MAPRMTPVPHAANRCVWEGCGVMRDAWARVRQPRGRPGLAGWTFVPEPAWGNWGLLLVPPGWAYLPGAAVQHLRLWLHWRQRR